jgi:hypothetical protein
MSDVADVRRFVEKLHDRLLRDKDLVARLAMATHELLENAVKFSANGTATIRVDIEDAEVCITTRNLARSADVDHLLAVAQEIKTTPDAMAFYLGLMSRAPHAQGGLGLGRIAAEGDMQIGLVFEGDVVEVCARSRLAG